MIFSWKFWFQPFRPGRFRFDSSIWTLFENLNLIFRSNKIWFEFDLKKLKSRTISKCDVLELVTSVVTIGGHAGWHIQKAESINVWIFCIVENVDFFFRAKFEYSPHLTGTALTTLRAREFHYTTTKHSINRQIKFPNFPQFYEFILDLYRHDVYGPNNGWWRHEFTCCYSRCSGCWSCRCCWCQTWNARRRTGCRSQEEENSTAQLWFFHRPVKFWRVLRHFQTLTKTFLEEAGEISW